MRKEIEDKINNSPDYQIVLEKMRIQDNEIEEIADFIIHKKENVHEIYLNNNFIGDEGGVIIGRKFLALLKLSRIDLQFNHLDKQGITAIVSLIKNNPELKLSLHGNKMTNVNALDVIERKFRNKPY